MGRRIVIFCLLSTTRRRRPSDKKAALLVGGRPETQGKTCTDVLTQTFQPCTQEAFARKTAGHLIQTVFSSLSLACRGLCLLRSCLQLVSVCVDYTQKMCTNRIICSSTGIELILNLSSKEDRSSPQHLRCHSQQLTSVHSLQTRPSCHHDPSLAVYVNRGWKKSWYNPRHWVRPTLMGTKY